MRRETDDAMRAMHDALDHLADTTEALGTGTAPATDLMGQTLTAYGVDPARTPTELTLEWTPAGIVIDQFVTRGPEPADIVMHEGEHGSAVDPVTVRRFFPHPLLDTTE